MAAVGRMIGMPNDVEVIALTPEDRSWLAARATELWGGEIVISRGVAHDVAKLPGFIARIDGRRAGVATYRLTDDACELVTIDAFQRRAGVGTALIAAVEAVAGDRRLWLITTNDNLDAMRFYQRRGYVLTAAYPGAIEASRRLKPQIPRVGNYGIPIRDELEFVRAK